MQRASYHGSAWKRSRPRPLRLVTAPRAGRSLAARAVLLPCQELVARQPTRLHIPPYSCTEQRRAVIYAMHYALICRLAMLAALCAFVSGCALLQAPGWSSVGGKTAHEGNPGAAVPAPAGGTVEEQCRAQAWRRRLEIPADPGLAYGEAYRECLRSLAGDRTSWPIGASQSSATGAAASGPRPLPVKPYRN
jgi:hypothetical protein